MSPRKGTKCRSCAKLRREVKLVNSFRERVARKNRELADQVAEYRAVLSSMPQIRKVQLEFCNRHGKNGRSWMKCEGPVYEATTMAEARDLVERLNRGGTGYRGRVHLRQPTQAILKKKKDGAARPSLPILEPVPAEAKTIVHTKRKGHLTHLPREKRDLKVLAKTGYWFCYEPDCKQITDRGEDGCCVLCGAVLEELENWNAPVMPEWERVRDVVRAGQAEGSAA